MGSSSGNTIDAQIAQAKKNLESAKKSRDRAKKNGNYKSCIKNSRRSNGQLGNAYDRDVWHWQDRIKELQDLKKSQKRR